MSFSTLGKPYQGYQKPSRPIDTVFLHCDASSNPNLTVMDIHNMHLSNGWSGCGYHIYIDDAGKAWHGRDISAVGAHASGYNTGSIGISCNGLKVSDFSEAQFDTVRAICNEINTAHGGNIRFRGHREVAAKECPVYDYRAVLGLDSAGHMGGDGTAPPPPSSTIPMVAVTANLAQVGQGDKHPHVRWLQNLLRSQGLDPGPSDGIFGGATDKAVRHFQGTQGLDADGIVGKVTWERLIDSGDD